MSVEWDPRLREILACPCPRHAQLTQGLPDEPHADYLTCTACGRSFPVRDGIPVLLLDESIGGPSGGGVAAGDAGEG